MTINSPRCDLRNLLVAAMLISVAISTVLAQETKSTLPRVASAAIPFYPPVARAANVQGIIHVRVSTDGHHTVTAKAQDGPKLLAIAAEENARTWSFAIHEPTTFTITYRYTLVPKMKGDPENPEIVMRLPSEIEVRMLLAPSNGDPAPDTR